MAADLLKLNGKVIGRLAGRRLIKSGAQAVLYRAMDGFGMPTVLIDALCSDDSDVHTGHPVTGSSGTAQRVSAPPTVIGAKGQVFGPTTRYNFDTVEVHYQDSVYQTSVRTFKDKGTVVRHPPYEAQYVLPRKEFLRIDSKQLTLI